MGLYHDFDTTPYMFHTRLYYPTFHVTHSKTDFIVV